MSTSSSDVEDDGLQTSNSGGGNSDEYYGDDAGISGGGGGGGSSGTFKDRFNKFAVSAKKASVKAGSKIAEKSKEVGSIVAEKSSKLGSQMAEKSSDLVDKAKQMKKPQIPNLLSRTGSKSGSLGSSPNSPALDVINKATVIFGVPLEEAVNISRLSRSIELPSIVQQCITYINAKGLDEEGIYRIPGSTTKVNHVKYLYNSGQPVNLELDMVDLHGVAGLLKLYMRELPEPLLTRDLTGEFQDACGLSEPDRFQRLKQLVQQLPLANFTVLQWMFRHLVQVAAHSDQNKMTLSNLGVVFSPCLDMAPMLFKVFMTETETLFVRQGGPAPHLQQKQQNDREWDDLDQPMDNSASTPINYFSPSSPAATTGAIAAPPRPARPPKAALDGSMSGSLGTGSSSSLKLSTPPKPPKPEKSLQESLAELDALVDDKQDYSFF